MVWNIIHAETAAEMPFLDRYSSPQGGVKERVQLNILHAWTYVLESTCLLNGVAMVILVLITAEPFFSVSAVSIALTGRFCSLSFHDCCRMVTFVLHCAMCTLHPFVKVHVFRISPQAISSLVLS